LKLRLILKTKTKKNKEISLKLPISPSRHIGFINFINLALNQDLPIDLSFEKISKTGDRDESKIFGRFKLQGKSDQRLLDLTGEIQKTNHKKKKLQQKRKQK